MLPAALFADSPIGANALTGEFGNATVSRAVLRFENGSPALLPLPLLLAIQRYKQKLLQIGRAHV